MQAPRNNDSSLDGIAAASRALREKASLSLRAAARLAGVSHKALWRVEQRKPVLGRTLLKVRAWATSSSDRQRNTTSTL